MTTEREALRRRIESAHAYGARLERTRVVGLLLSEVGRLRTNGQREASEVVDRLALRVEHPEA
jgi:hypothetical protein